MLARLWSSQLVILVGNYFCLFNNNCTILMDQIQSDLVLLSCRRQGNTAFSIYFFLIKRMVGQIYIWLLTTLTKMPFFLLFSAIFIFCLILITYIQKIHTSRNNTNFNFLLFKFKFKVIILKSFKFEFVLLFYLNCIHVQLKYKL